MRRLLRDVRISLETVNLSDEDRDDAITCFTRFVAEMAKSAPHPDRLMRYWRWLDELAPTAAHELATSEIIQHQSMRWGDCIQPKGGFLNERAAKEFVQKIADKQVRDALEWAYGQMVELSFWKAVRPEGGFDLLYFYRLLASCFEEGYYKAQIPEARPTNDPW